MQNLLKRPQLPLSEAERYYERAMHYYDRGNYDLAIDDMSAAIESDDQNAEYYAVRGMFHLEIGELEEAWEDLRWSLALNPDKSEAMLAFYGLGALAYARGEYAEAAARFTEAIETAPKRPEPHYFRAVAYFREQRYIDAEADMMMAIQLMKEDDPRVNQGTRWINAFRKHRAQRVRRAPRPDEIEG